MTSYLASDTDSSDAEELELRPYQVKGIEWITSTSRGIIADEAGLGKTIEAVNATGNQQVLIICPKVAIGVWQRELRRWLNAEPMLFFGTPKQRGKLTEEYLDTPLELRPQYVITTYAGAEWVYYWQKHWPLVICDEAHQMRNRKSKAFANVRALRFQRLYHLTASPIVNHFMDMWPLFYLIDRKKFGSYWRFASDHCHVVKGDFGFEVSGPKNPRQSRQMLAPYILRRTKKVVLPDLPPKVRKAIPLELHPEQRRMYDELALEKLFQLESGEIIVAPNKMSELLRLRQILVTPALLGGPNYSAALDALKEAIQDDYCMPQPVSIYCPFAKAFEFIEEILRDVGAEEIYQIRGGMTHKQITQTEDDFRRSKHKRRAIMISLLSATSFSIETCTQGYFLGSHWNPEVNSQAEDRMHRMTTKNMVVCNYFQHAGTVDEHILKILNKKLTWSRLILDPERLLFGSRKQEVARMRLLGGRRATTTHSYTISV